MSAARPPQSTEDQRHPNEKWGTRWGTKSTQTQKSPENQGFNEISGGSVVRQTGSGGDQGPVDWMTKAPNTYVRLLSEHYKSRLSE